MILLITWLWQGIAVACATATVLARARALDAATRHAVWWAATAAVVSLPAVHALAALDAEPIPSDAALPVPPAPDWVLQTMLLAWLVFAAAGLLRTALSLRSLYRLKRAGEPLDCRRVLGRAWRPRDSASAVEVRVWDGHAGACALGLGRPVILVSRALVDALDEHQLAAIVMHERAHLERHDDWWQLLQAVVSALVGWHPAVWLMSRHISLEREAACDDHVITRIGAPRVYAQALVATATAQTTWSAAIPGATRSPSALRIRIHRMLDSRVDRRTSPRFTTSLATAATLALTVAAAIRVPPLVVLVDAISSLPIVAAAPQYGTTPTLSPRLMPPADPFLRSLRPTRPAQPTVDAPAATKPQPSASPALPPMAVLTRGSGLAGPLPAPAALALVPASDSRATLQTLSPAPDPPWRAVAQSAGSAGEGIGTIGAAAGDKARDAGVSIGRFFSRTGKAIARRF